MTRGPDVTVPDRRLPGWPRQLLILLGLLFVYGQIATAGVIVWQRVNFGGGARLMEEGAGAYRVIQSLPAAVTAVGVGILAAMYLRWRSPIGPLGFGLLLGVYHYAAYGGFSETAPRWRIANALVAVLIAVCSAVSMAVLRKRFR